MNKQFLRHYNIELSHIRKMAGEFAQDFPKIAGRLALDRDGKDVCPDPFVERLLEGFAFLTARIQVKFDSEFPRLTQSLIESVFPHYLAPLPSMLIAKFDPEIANPDLIGGVTLPRQSILRSHLGGSTTTHCEFRTAHEVTLWPLNIAAVHYHTRDFGRLKLPAGLRPKAVIAIKLELTAGNALKELATDRLTFHLRGNSDLTSRLYEQILGHVESICLLPSSGKTSAALGLPQAKIRAVGFDPNEALLPCDARSFDGYRLLREYFSFPQRFQFFEVNGLSQALKGMDSTSFEILLVLDQADNTIENLVDVTALDLFCTPAINLFPKRFDRIPLKEKFSEYQVIPDRTRLLDYEVFGIDSVAGFGGSGTEEQAFTPFYYNNDRDLHSKAYYTLQRSPRIISARERQNGTVSNYTGSDLTISIVDGNSAPFNPGVFQLGLSGLCTNRHLPIQMPIGVRQSDFSLDVSAPVESTRCISPVSPPRPSSAEGEMSWRIISHLSLNYLSLLDSNDGSGATAFREILSLYAPEHDAYLKKQIAAVLSVSARPIVRRVASPGPIAFARGTEITMRCEEKHFGNAGLYLFGSVLERFFAKYASINSFTETVLESDERGEIKRWAAQPGSRAVL